MGPFRNVATHFGAWCLHFFGWIIFGLFVFLVDWFGNVAYDIHWLIAAPIRIFAGLLGLGWILAGLLLLICLPVVVWNVIRGEKTA